MSEKKTPAKKAANHTEAPTPSFTLEQLRLASDTAKARVSAEMSDTVWSNVVETMCKLHLRYTMEALVKEGSK